MRFILKNRLAIVYDLKINVFKCMSLKLKTPHKQYNLFLNRHSTFTEIIK